MINISNGGDDIMEKPETDLSNQSQELLIKSLRGILERHRASVARGEYQPLPDEYYNMVEEQIKKYHDNKTVKNNG